MVDESLSQSRDACLVDVQHSFALLFVGKDGLLLNGADGLAHVGHQFFRRTPTGPYTRNGRSGCTLGGVGGAEDADGPFADESQELAVWGPGDVSD